jgi:hypothetical protein
LNLQVQVFDWSDAQFSTVSAVTMLPKIRGTEGNKYTTDLPEKYRNVLAMKYVAEKASTTCTMRKPLLFWLMPSRQNRLPSRQNGLQANLLGVGG